MSDDNNLIIKMSKLTFGWPSNQNTYQKIGFFGHLAIMCLVLFLHFPFSGYKTEYSYTVDLRDIVVSKECKEFDNRKDFKGGLDAEFNMNKRCGDEWEKQHWRTVELPFSEWNSNEPVVQWFGNLVHMVASLAFAVVLGVLWMWTFKSKVSA
jgi:hypothetical protein